MRQLSPFPLPANSSVSIRPHGMQELLRAQATMWKMSPGVIFINVLQAAFTHADPESGKKTVKFSVFFTLSGSEHEKAADRILMKLTTGWFNSKMMMTNVVFLLCE